MMRKISPEAYGQIGMLNIFIAVSMIFIDSGFGNALIQKKDASQKDYSTAFWLNNSFCLICYVVIFFSAPAIATFYNDPELILLVRILGLNLFFCAIGMVPQAMMQKELRFKSLARSTVIANILSGILGIVLAYRNANVWAIVIQMISMYLIRSGLIILETKWLPKFVFDRDSFKSLVGFGSKMLFSNLLDQIFLNVHVAVIGKFFKPQVGHFSQANKFSQLFFGFFATPIHTVSMSTMSIADQSYDEFQRTFRRFLQMAAFMTFPVVLGAIAVAEPGFRLLFTEVWMPVVPMFQWMCASGLLLTIFVINQNVLKSYGRTDLVLASNVIRKSYLLVAIFVGVQWGVKGILIGYFCCSILDFLVNAYFTSRIIRFPISTQFLSIWRSLTLSLMMFGGIIMCGNLPITNGYVLIFLQLSIGIIIYVAGAFLFCRESFSEASNIIRMLLIRIFPQKKSTVTNMPRTFNNEP